jgi:hypothetical protein
MGVATEMLIRDQLKLLIVEQQRTNQLLEHMCKQLGQLVEVTQGQPRVWAGAPQ